MKLKPGMWFRLGGFGKWCKITRVKENSVSFEMAGKIAITGSTIHTQIQKYLSLSN